MGIYLKILKFVHEGGVIGAYPGSADHFAKTPTEIFMVVSNFFQQKMAKIGQNGQNDQK
jgi:hypothetical protein